VLGISGFDDDVMFARIRPCESDASTASTQSDSPGSAQNRERSLVYTIGLLSANARAPSVCCTCDFDGQAECASVSGSGGSRNWW